MKKDFRELLKNIDVIMLDTCFAMRDEFPNFIESIEVDLLSYDKKIKVKSVVMAELCRKMGSNDELVRKRATNAVSTIGLRRNIFVVDEERVDAEAIRKAFADAEFISDFSTNRIRYKIALLTNDQKLSNDINKLNELESCNGKDIKVFYLNNVGEIEESKYDVEQNENISKMTDKTFEKEKEVFPKEIKYMLYGTVSFVAGVLTAKYGRKFAETIVRAFA